MEKKTQIIIGGVTVVILAVGAVGYWQYRHGTLNIGGYTGPIREDDLQTLDYAEIMSGGDAKLGHTLTPAERARGFQILVNKLEAQIADEPTEDAYNQLSALYFNFGRNTDAVTTLESGIAKFPDSQTLKDSLAVTKDAIAQTASSSSDTGVQINQSTSAYSVQYDEKGESVKTEGGKQ